MDTANLFVTATGKVESYWNVCPVTLLALIGWLISTEKRPWPHPSHCGSRIFEGVPNLGDELV